ncbi:MAG: spiro-SPASM protein [Treponema sp.]|nr:spiro-SPASM protein [Treponema sp.]
MNALLVLYAGNLSAQAAEPVFGEKNSLSLAIERSRNFPGVGKTVVLTGPAQASLETMLGNPVPEDIVIENRDGPWTVKALLEAIAAHSQGETRPFDFSYFAWADCPFLDPALAGKLAERHLRYAAEYSYADGWPYGLAPELLSPGTAAILAKILGDADGGPVGRDVLFSVIQKDINVFDIETEISSVDLRCHRISLCADSGRNLLLLRRFATTGTGTGTAEIPDTAKVERIIAETPGTWGGLRTLPAFYPIQVSGCCPQSCAFCPWPLAGGGPVTERRDYMEAGQFKALLDKITAFSGDAVIDLSLWGEVSLHPQKMELIEMVLRRPELALVIETSGIGWKTEELEQIAVLARERRTAYPPVLSWIVSLDTADPARYKEIRGAGFAEANDCAKKLLALFPKDAYVQAVRTVGAEDDIERFYRSWKDAAANIIIQKYDDFCGMLPRKQASDLSPVERQPCWHLMRDMPILIDGTVPLCRQQIHKRQNCDAVMLGNAFTESLEAIWERGQRHYDDQACAKYDSLCEVCDEYYTYNF